MKRAVVASWATVARRHATIGDLLAVGVVVDALSESGCHVKLALPGEPLPEIGEGPRVWVSGPVDFSYDKQSAILGHDGAGWIVSGATLISREPGHPIRADITTARDAPGQPTNADFAILAPITAKGRRAAVLLRGHQPEYRQDESIHQVVASGVRSALQSTGYFPLPLATDCPEGFDPIVAAATLEDVLAQSDLVVTSRLHGVIHALRAGKFPVVIDEIIEGGKVSACAREFDLPFLRPEGDFVERLIALIHDCRARDTAEIALLRTKLESSASTNLARLVGLVGQQ